MPKTNLEINPETNSETKTQIKAAIRHPVTWWKGADLPEEKIRPWEGGIQLMAEALKGFMDGFTGIRGNLYLGMGAGKIPPNWKSVHDVIRITWDAANDPLIGAHMDRKRYSEKIHRWIMRFNATFSPFFILIQCFNFGMTPMQRLIQWTLVTMFSDIMSTANAVSESKIWAGITPHSEQRGLLQLCKDFGGSLAGWVSGLPMLLMGLRDVFHWTDYQIMIYGALLFMPLTIFCRWLPSYAKQRVDFTVKVKGEDETEETAADTAERPPSFRESISVVKHNRWFIIWTIINFVRLFIPGTDFMFFYRFLVRKINFRGKPILLRGEPLGGEILYVFRGLIFATPSALLQPLAAKVASKFKNKANFVRLHVIVAFVQYLSTYLIGRTSYLTLTWPKLIFIFTMEGIREVFDKWNPVVQGMINYEMFDYVEWKTGQRSEGMTMAVNGMLNKLVKDNVSSVFGNAVTQWTQYQGWDVPAEQQPERFIKSIWPLRYLTPAIGEMVVFIILLWFKYGHDPKEVEADLIERRALAQKMKEEVEV